MNVKIRLVKSKGKKERERRTQLEKEEAQIKQQRLAEEDDARFKALEAEVRLEVESRRLSDFKKALDEIDGIDRRKITC